MSRIVIVGAGQGGFQAAASLRQEGFSGDITLIGDEAGLPYQRPPLSKAYLKTGDADALALRAETFFTRNDITRVQARVEGIDRAAHCVQAGGQRFDYDHLILAMGTRNARPPIRGVEQALDLRTLADAQVLRERLDNPIRCAVIGAGFIGLEFAAVARALGHEVTVAEAATRVMARVLSEDMSRHFSALHAAMGTQVYLGSAVCDIRETGLVLASGQEIEAELVLLAAGVVPNVELAQQAGLSCDNGIVVDARLLTEDPAISALGDCCAFPDPVRGIRVRLESVQAATDHARLIAKRVVHGDQAPYGAVPWFWSDQGDQKLQIAGLAMPQDTAERLQSGAVLRFFNERLVAVETVNDARTHMLARRLLSGAPVSRDDAGHAFAQTAPARA